MKRFYLPKMGNRRQPGLSRFGFAAYKSDGNKSAELEALEKLTDATEQRYKELKDELASKTKELLELKEFSTDAVKKGEEYAATVKELNSLLGEKGATLKQIQDEVKELQAKNGQLKNPIPEQNLGMKQLLLKEFESCSEKLKGFRGDIHKSKDSALELFTTKAVGTMTTSANITGVSISAVPTWSNEWAVRGRQLVHARDLMRVINTATGLFLFMRQNTPTGEGSVDSASGPGQLKPTIDYDLTMVTVNAKYRAGIVDIAAEMEQDIPNLSQFITEELTEDYLKKETFDFINTLVTTATGTSGVPGGVTVLAEKIPHWVANLEQQNWAPTDIVVRPRLWATLLNTKPSDYSTPGGFVITPSGDVIFAGLRLVKCPTNALSDSQVLIGDFRKAVIAQKSGEGFRVEMFKSHDKHVYQNIITFRGEARAEIAVLRPDAFVVGTA
jgi:HK97 family phage major capsid protein